MTETKNILNLISLLDDSDEFVFNHVREKLLELGGEAIPQLMLSLSGDNLLLDERIKNLIDEIYFSDIDKKFKELSQKEGSILEDAVFLIASFGYPELDMSKYRDELDDMGKKLTGSIDRMKENPLIPKGDPLQVINLINNFLFYQKGYKGNSENFYEPENTFLNDVMERKKGIPISLSILYLLLCKRLNLPAYGVNLPAHFIIKYIDNNDEFYIDPFNKGIVISKSEAVKFLSRIGLTKEDFENISFLKPAEDKDIIRRTLNNLVNIYTRSGDIIKTDQLKKLMGYFE
ncbi:MAG: transglutaminase-like domain-containing protein [Ignavibacteria bacterium]|nr:transglutaminase-like domain-containing protein [Ignavibacteria bacterium]